MTSSGAAGGPPGAPGAGLLSELLALVGDAAAGSYARVAKGPVSRYWHSRYHRLTPASSSMLTANTVTGHSSTGSSSAVITSPTPVQPVARPQRDSGTSC